MIIEDQENFKTWLTKVLEPLCDADPAALAKYVFALVKKDKPIPELRASMVEQLDVFLQQETKNFVDLLFTTLENKNYHIVKGDPEFTKTTGESEEINSSSPKPSTNLEIPPDDTQISSTISNGAVTNVINESSMVTTSVSKSPRTFEHVSNSSGSVPYIGTSPSPERTVAGGSTSARSNTVPPTCTGSGRDSSRSRSRSPAYNPRANRSGARSRSKSRSRSWDRGERVPRRDRRDRSTRAWRNKSPPSRRHERRRSWSRNRASRSRSRSPRYPTHRGRYRNRSPPQNRPTQTSNAIRTTSRVQSTGTPTQDSNHGDVDMRLNTTSQSIHSLIGKENVAASELSTGTSSANANTFPKRRCNDFDEKGYCMRGDLCPYDHGNDPVVLEDIALSRVLTFGPGAAGPAAAAPGATPGNTSGTTTVTSAPVAASGPVVSPRVPPQTTVGSSSSSLVGLEATVQPPPSGTSLHQIQGSVHNAQPSINVRPFISTMEYNPDEPSIAPRMTWTRNTYRTTMNSGHRDLRNSRAGPGLQGNINGIPTYTPQRELISVPMSIEHSFTHNVPFKKRRTEDVLNDMSMKKKTAFDFNRLGPRSKNSHNSSLELKKVPRGLNTIEHLNNHFAKFGKIVNIQITYEGDPEAAIVTFSSHAEANAAYRSTEAVLNNRFIKVFWHNSNETKDNTVSNNMALTTQSTLTQSLNSGASNTSTTTINLTPSPVRLSVKERLGFPAKNPLANPHRLINHPPNPSDQDKTQPHFNLTKTVYIPTAMRKPEASSTPTSPVAVHANTPDSIQQTQPESDANKKASELIAAKKLLKIKHEEKRQEALKLTVNLRKRKQDLLDKQLQQQRELLTRLEKTTNQEQRDDILGTLRTLQDNIQHIKKDLTDVVNTMSTQVKQNKNTTTVKRNREEAQKELLDAELDLINKQQEGEDTTEIQRRIAQLKAETRGSSISNNGPSKSTNSYNRFSSGRHATNRTLMRNASNSGHGATSLYRTNGGSRNSRINPGTITNTFPHSSVDHRPTHILISGYEADDKDQVLEHFSQFGQVTEISVDEFTPSVVLGYSTRKEAEVAVTKGRTFQDRLLSVTWSHGNSSAVSSNSVGTNSSSSVVAVGATANASSASLPQTMTRTIQNRFIKGGQTLSQIKNEDPKIDDNLNQVEEEEKISENIEEPKHVLLGDEDEEDEDGEVRSWRR